MNKKSMRVLPTVKFISKIAKSVTKEQIFAKTIKKKQENNAGFHLSAKKQILFRGEITVQLQYFDIL